ncbi:hypothetical protein F4780DRAFT_782782 [Xylariomycetidae sp. FL0641]|nr:hypothetical protein F4780DRAFT_782782 [Xylariomycetidae sp. FL0641]
MFLQRDEPAPQRRAAALQPIPETADAERIAQVDLGSLIDLWHGVTELLEQLWRCLARQEQRQRIGSHFRDNTRDTPRPSRRHVPPATTAKMGFFYHKNFGGRHFGTSVHASRHGVHRGPWRFSFGKFNCFKA